LYGAVAPNDRCGELAVPDNITLLYLPRYSPELNPKENLWDEIREKIFKNSSRTMRSSPWMLCALNSRRPSSTSSAILNSSAPSPLSLYRQLTLM
jgi:transposase